MLLTWQLHYFVHTKSGAATWVRPAVGRSSPAAAAAAAEDSVAFRVGAPPAMRLVRGVGARGGGEEAVGGAASSNVDAWQHPAVGGYDPWRWDEDGIG